MGERLARLITPEVRRLVGKAVVNPGHRFADVDGAALVVGGQIYRVVVGGDAFA